MVGAFVVGLVVIGKLAKLGARVAVGLIDGASVGSATKMVGKDDGCSDGLMVGVDGPALGTGVG